jgi:predicted anti-sigma-YlaC factor YlaD
MKPDRHEEFQKMIDESLTLGISAEDNPSLREHLQSCTVCQGYLDASSRVIASLGSFSFDVDPMLQERVMASLRQRAPQVHALQFSRKQVVLMSLLAVVLTVAGSWIDLQAGRLIASALNLQGMHLQQGLLTFWIGPSLCLLLLFPLLPLLSKWRERIL